MERRADAEADASPRRLGTKPLGTKPLGTKPLGTKPLGTKPAVRPVEQNTSSPGLIGHAAVRSGERTRYQPSGLNVLMLQRLAGNAAVSAMLAPRRPGKTPERKSEKPGDAVAPVEGSPQQRSAPLVDGALAPASSAPRSAAPAGARVAPPGPAPARPRLAMPPPGAMPPPRAGKAPSLPATPVSTAHGQVKTAAAEAKADASIARLEAAVADVAKAVDKVAEVERPAETTAGGAQLVDAVVDGERRGRGQLAAASQTAAAQIAGGTAAEVGRVRSAGAMARSATDAAVISTHTRVAEVTSTHRGQVVETSAAATTRIGSWQQQAQTQLGGAFDQGVNQIGKAADQHATAVRATATEASAAVVSQAGGAAEGQGDLGWGRRRAWPGACGRRRRSGRTGGGRVPDRGSARRRGAGPPRRRGGRRGHPSRTGRRRGARCRARGGGSRN